jgi:hypothetical protein
MRLSGRQDRYDKLMHPPDPGSAPGIRAAFFSAVVTQ